MIILDFGSGNTCQNNWSYAKKMIDELKKVDTGKHEIVIKWQLFQEAGENIPLKPDIFTKAYDYAKKLGYNTTSSVFDQESLDFLLQFNIPFVKIANNRSLDWLVGEIKRKFRVYVSYGNTDELKFAFNENVNKLLCVSRYPAGPEDYQETFDLNYYVDMCGYGISDHTTNFNLWNEHQPEIVEWHYKLQDSTGLDAGDFARTPEQLAEVL